MLIYSKVNDDVSETEKGEICVTFCFINMFSKGTVWFVRSFYMLVIYKKISTTANIIPELTEFLSLHRFKEKASVKESHEFTHMKKKHVSVLVKHEILVSMLNVSSSEG